MHYPVNLVVTGRKCLVVGGGRVALRKVASLVECGALVTVVAPVVIPAIEALGVTIVRRPYRRDEVDGYWLAITATDDPAVNQAVFDDGVAHRVWVNSADDPERCSFTLPAVVRHDPVLVTASTGGTAPALAAWLRRRLEAEIGPELAEVARRVSAERDRVHAAGGSTEGIDWDAVIEAYLAAEAGR
jgi:siroheme synthase-like protein